MFDIKYLLIPILTERLNNISEFTEKADFLLKLIDFEIYFREYEDKIIESWNNETDERYSAEDYNGIFGDKDFIKEYAEKIENTEKIIDLINKLCNPDVFDYDTVIADAQNDIAVIRNIDDFEFLDTDIDKKEKKAVKKTKLDVLLKFEPKN